MSSSVTCTLSGSPVNAVSVVPRIVCLRHGRMKKWPPLCAIVSAWPRVMGPTMTWMPLERMSLCDGAPLSSMLSKRSAQGPAALTKIFARTAADAPDLVVLHLIPEAFKPGSQKEREVTTVAGATSIKVNVQFTSRDGKVLLEKDVVGKVRFYGENLRATYDLAKKVSALVNESF